MNVSTTAVTVVASQARGGASSHVATLAVLAACAIVLVLIVVAMIVSPRWRRAVPRVVAVLVCGLLAVYLVGRGIAEFWIVDYSDPASYRNDWGGPSLVGVLAVHSGPGLAIVIAGLVWFRRRGRRRNADTKPVQPSASGTHKG